MSLVLAQSHFVAQQQLPRNVVFVPAEQLVLAHHQRAVDEMDEEKVKEYESLENRSRAKSTVKNYDSDLKSFVRFLKLVQFKDDVPDRMLHPQTGEMDPSRATFVECLDYVKHMVQVEKRALNTCRRRWSFLRSKLIPSLAQDSVKRRYEQVLDGILHEAKLPDPKKALLMPQLHQYLDTLPEEKSNETEQLKTYLLMSFHGALRRSEAIAARHGWYRFDKRGMTIIIQGSKTDKKRVGQKICLNRRPGKYCPVAAVERWIQRCGGFDPLKPLFRGIGNHDEILEKHMCIKRAVKIIKDACVVLDIPPGEYGCHSLRSGMLTSFSDTASYEQLRSISRHTTIAGLQPYLRAKADFSHGL